MATQLNQDRIHTADRGSLSDPKQSAGFISDPMLTPYSSSSAPHPILPDPSPSDNPEHFDPSTRHPNTDYHPDKKLSKKKRAKKLGVVSAADHVNHHAPASYVGHDTFSSHEKQALERQHKREEVLAAREQHEAEEGSEEDMDEDDEEGDYEHEGHTKSDAELRQSKQQPHSERVTGKEGDKGKGTTSTATSNKSSSEKSDANAKNAGNKEKEQGHDKGAEANPSLLARASGAASGLASKVMHTGVVSSLMSKVGLAGGKTEQEHATDKGKTEKSEPTNEDMEAAGK